MEIGYRAYLSIWWARYIGNTELAADFIELYDGIRNEKQSIRSAANSVSVSKIGIMLCEDFE